MSGGNQSYATFSTEYFTCLLDFYVTLHFLSATDSIEVGERCFADYDILHILWVFFPISNFPAESLKDLVSCKFC